MESTHRVVPTARLEMLLPETQRSSLGTPGDRHCNNGCTRPQRWGWTRGEADGQRCAASSTRGRRVLWVPGRWEVRESLRVLGTI